MLSLLRAWLINRRRRIFRFWDGKRLRAVDPLVVRRALLDDPVYDPESHNPLLQVGDDAAIRAAVNATRSAFGVRPLDAGGLTEMETLGLLGDFFTFLAALKKNTGTPQSSAESTASSAAGDSTTKPMSDCC